MTGAKICFASFNIAFHEKDSEHKRMNRALQAAISERRRVGWWNLAPVYIGKKGLREIPKNIEVARFKGVDNCDLFVIDNWNNLEGTSFFADTKRITVPKKKLSILKF